MTPSTAKTPLSPFTHSDGRRTAANLVDCLLADVEVVCGGMSAPERRSLENRFHVTLRADRRIRERFSKKRKREILRGVGVSEDK